MIDGFGAPEGPEASPDFQSAIQALYSVTYTLKFTRKKTTGPDYTVGPLEGLWWMADDTEFDQARAADWRWTLMIMQPDFITQDEFARAIAQCQAKKPNP